MRIVEPGHVYRLSTIDGDLPDVERTLVFVNREPGTQTQEVLRALIDRTYHCDYCMPSELNAMIIHHLRMALVYHEMRAPERKTEKGALRPDEISTDEDGHFRIYTSQASVGDPLRAPRREFKLSASNRECKRREY